ncbi:MAG: PA14 domain-containing protein, partial [Planctomycetota bacterium]
MNKKVPLILAALTVIANVAFSPLDAGAEAAKRPGLVGTQYGSEDFTDLQNVSRLDNLEPSWSEADDYGRQWSAEWEGLIVAPATGRIAFAAETDQALQIKIAGETVIESKKGTLAGSVSMVEAKQYPIKITYVKGGQSYDCYFRIQWSWAGQAAVSAGLESLFHTDQQEQQWLDKARQVEDEEDDDDDDDEDDGDDDGDGASLLEQPSHLWQASDAASAGTPGLVGLICENPRFKEPASQDIIKHVNHDWTGGPGDWSGYWQGFISGPFTGEVTFNAEVDNGIRLAIGDKIVIDGLGRRKTRVGKALMVRGKKYPIRLWYFQDGDPSYLRLYWSWVGQDKLIVDESAFSYGQADVEYVISKLPGEYWEFEEAPLHFDGTGSESLDLAHQDGRVAPVVGVESYQVFRSNRQHPEFTGGLKNTYIHAPMLCYWKGKYYLEFLAAPVNEHDAKTVTLMTTSVDGRNWETPKILFPAFKPDGDDHMTISHQRMGFYISRDNRLLILSFYGRYPSPNEGDGVGRAVREVYEDGTVGPLYFIRYNRHAGWNEKNTPYPYYKESSDKGFVAACDELMANKLMVQQWWEEDRSKDGFYMLSGEEFKCKAFNWYTRRDGAVVGMFKAGYAVLSEDGGKTWSDIKKLPSVIVGHAKMWGQQTEDGRFAFVYNPHFEWRYPLVVATSDDGRVFSNLACAHGELPPRRYDGDAKDVGPQYVRGITPGNGNPPGKEMWLTYSMNKEDIWISRVPLPIRHDVDKWVNDSFDGMKTGGIVTDWNIYSLKWAPVE